MSIQPGVGYNLSSSKGAVSLVIDQPWQMWTPPHPFTVISYKSGSDYLVQVVPGTICNIEPTISGTQLSAVPAPTLNIGYSASPQTVYIYVNTPVAGSGTPPAWPDSAEIISDTTPQVSDDTEAFLLLATVDNSTGVVSQYVSGSQWGERYKCGANDAVYYYGLV